MVIMPVMLLELYAVVTTSILLPLAKSGVAPSDSLELARYVRSECPNLEFCGFMTIGMLDYSSTPENFKVKSAVGYTRKVDSGAQAPVSFLLAWLRFLRYILRFSLKSLLRHADFEKVPRGSM